MDIVGESPPEIAEMILRYLTPAELMTCSTVSRRWQQLVDTSRLWTMALPYYRNVANFWNNFGQRFKGLNDCQLMNRYAMERRVRNNLIENIYCVASIIPNNCQKVKSGSSQDGWLTHKGELYLWSGEKLEVPLPSRWISNLHLVSVIISPNTRYLALTCTNIIFILEHRPPSTRLALIGLLAITDNTTKDSETGDQSAYTVHRSSKLDPRSLDRFIKINYAKNINVHAKFFTGFNTISDARLCFSVVRYNDDDLFMLCRETYFIWDMEKHVVVQQWDNQLGGIAEGWDRRGICVISRTKIIFFNDSGQKEQTIVPSVKSITHFKILYDFSAAVAVSHSECENNHNSKLILWKKNSNETKVLLENDSISYLSSSSTAIIYMSLKYGAINILSAPEWRRVAVIPCHDVAIHGLNFFSFSDGSHFLIISVDHSYYWYDVDGLNGGEQEKILQVEDRHEMDIEPSVEILLTRGQYMACKCSSGETFILSFACPKEKRDNLTKRIIALKRGGGV